jgi:hypothetical protein
VRIPIPGELPATNPSIPARMAPSRQPRRLHKPGPCAGILRHKFSTVPRNRQVANPRKPGKPGTVTGFRALFAGNPVTVPGFAPREYAPVRRVPKTVTRPVALGGILTFIPVD